MLWFESYRELMNHESWPASCFRYSIVCFPAQGTCTWTPGRASPPWWDHQGATPTSPPWPTQPRPWQVSFLLKILLFLSRCAVSLRNGEGIPSAPSCRNLGKIYWHWKSRVDVGFLCSGRIFFDGSGWLQWDCQFNYNCAAKGMLGFVTWRRHNNLRTWW